MPAPGETNIDALVRQLSPRLDDTVWVFAAVPPAEVPERRSEALACFEESEAVTLILPVSAAHGLTTVSGSRARITLQVQSSLDAVGLTACVAQALADEGISANVVAAFYHDHIFVPHARRFDAVACLTQLS